MFVSIFSTCLSHAFVPMFILWIVFYNFIFSWVSRNCAFSGFLLLEFLFLFYCFLCSRSRIAIIPQEPFLFCGTVRQNIDPLDQYCDSELVAALRRCHLAAAINRLGGVESQVGHGGLNLSVGQRQLLCLVRAVLHNAKVGDVLADFYSVLSQEMHHMTS